MMDYAVARPAFFQTSVRAKTPAPPSAKWSWLPDAGQNAFGENF
jgi:hypothetical protein